MCTFEGEWGVMCARATQRGSGSDFTRTVAELAGAHPTQAPPTITPRRSAPLQQLKPDAAPGVSRPSWQDLLRRFGRGFHHHVWSVLPKLPDACLTNARTRD